MIKSVYIANNLLFSKSKEGNARESLLYNDHVENQAVDALALNVSTETVVPVERVPFADVCIRHEN